MSRFQSYFYLFYLSRMEVNCCLLYEFLLLFTGVRHTGLVLHAELSGVIICQASVTEQKHQKLKGGLVR